MEELNVLMECNDTLLNLYKILMDYDILKFKDENIYNKVISRIKAIRQIEERYIGAINPDALIENQNKLLQEIVGDVDADFIEDVLAARYDHMSGKRVINQLYYYGLEHEYFEIAYAENVSDEELEEIMSKDGIYQHGISIELIREKVIAHTLLDYIKDAINEAKDERVREKLIRAKYYLIYVMPVVEEDFLDNPRSFSKRVKYMDMLLTSNMSPLETQEYCQVVSGIILGLVNDLEALPDEYFDSEDNQIDAYIKTFYLKTIYSINISEQIGEVINNSRQELEKRNKKNGEYIKAGLDKNLSYRMCKNVD